MDDQESEKKSVWLKYCEACVKSKIGNANRSHSDGCCTLNKEGSLNS
ncbi:MAG: hypothetical protein KGD73_09125 [Candidatus Lokiarchaeota archaeon]|nr:hypothetical protein [Candidatus Lokiarchaeota archaeon]